jgi:hypothetical protein
LSEYRKALYTKLGNQPQAQDVEQEWNQIKKAITEAAQETIQTQNNKRKNGWWDNDCQQAIKEKNEARKTWLQHRTRASNARYHKKRNEANRTCNRKKKEWLNNKISQIEENHKRNETKKFFKEIKQLTWQNTRLPDMCKDDKKVVLTQMGQILNRWKEYFSTLMNTEKENQSVTQVTQSKQPNSQPDKETPVPSFNEVCFIINNLKNGKAGGTDNILPELIKYGGRVLKQRIYKLILKIWEEEQLPSQWNEGIICPVYKKGDRLDCNNYRPITLLNVVYKIFAIILNQRLVDIVEPMLGEYQSGFRPNRTTIENIFMVRQIIEKCYEYNIDIHNIFIDYSHAFDSIQRGSIQTALYLSKIPPKLINLIRLTLENTTAKVKVNNAYTKDFKLDSGVKQGDPLSPTLFNLVMDLVISQLDLRGNISTRLKQLMAYADDILISARTKGALIEALNQISSSSKEVGLRINIEKTKYMKCTKKDNNKENLNCSNLNMSIEQVHHYKYLGSTINDNNSIEEEIKGRIALGTKAYYANLKFFKSKLVTKNSKLKLYRAVIRPIVTYASETWVLKDSSIQKLLVFERKILRKIFGPTRENQMWRIKTNDELDKLIKHHNIINYIKAQRLSWFGHVQRMPASSTVKKIFKWTPLSTKSKGRPKQRWENNIIQDIRQMKIKNWTTCVQDRATWKNIVEKAKTFKGGS